MRIFISKFNEDYHVTVETTKGHRYYTIYSHYVTEDEVKEDFKECKSSFYHVN